MAHYLDFVSDVASVLRVCINNGSSDSSACDYLAELGAGIVKQRLQKRIRAASISEDASMERVSLSLLGNLFAANPNGSIALKKALADYSDSDDIDLFLRFQSVLIKSASQELFHRWKESDQLGSRTWRNLHHALKNNPELILFPSNIPRWVALTQEIEIKPEMPPIDFVGLCRHVGQAVFETRGLGSITIQVLIKITENPLLMRAIEIDELFAAFKKAYSELKEDLPQKNGLTEPDNLYFIMALEKASKAAVERAEVAIEKYDSSGKLSQETARFFQNALSLIISDYSDGGICQSYYEYLKENWTSLNKENYRKNLRSKFEYLAEITLGEFNKVMKNEYYD